MTDLRAHVFDTYARATPWLLRYGVWTMDRDSYDQLRAAFATEADERDREAHSVAVYVRADLAEQMCPACGLGPFTLASLSEHVTARSGAVRDPQPGDVLLGHPVSVRDSAGLPDLVTLGVSDCRWCYSPDTETVGKVESDLAILGTDEYVMRCGSCSAEWVRDVTGSHVKRLA